ncbi:nitrilase-related carbon-nitrogen hydrolase [Kosmotoga sp. DU53]|uniref:nitrilase-related carbon-nitrogen hydrolase n=1 Tax=Kosmotoga sp. DU53 TaxID=1310160 RepID=UPI0007C56B3F|nr:nitrilase-related carbon-nitrogen hydrolase [Kosmotoga sp. DU53]MDK2953729.1 hypothetical protein [Kosmotoga sp.]OAA21019.1 nitrilase [Kosmotoga sp. DU53]
MKLLRRFFEKKLTLKRALRVLDGIHPTSVRKISFRVSCVQRSIKGLRRIDDYVLDLHRFVREAAGSGSALIVFPEYNMFDLFMLIPGFKILNMLMRKTPEGNEERKENEKGVSPLIYEAFLAISEPARRLLEGVMVKLAEMYGIYIYTGSYFLEENGKLFNAGTLISDSGEILGRQKKLHLTDFEEAMGLSRGNELHIFQSPIGKLAMPVCMDATYFETFYIAAKKEADVVILPIANAEEYDVYKALRGIWGRVQETYLYGVKASLNGWFGGMHFTGRAGIFAPIEMTERKNGVVAISPKYEGDLLITADLDIEALEMARKNAEFYGDTNVGFEERYMKRLRRCAGIR